MENDKCNNKEKDDRDINDLCAKMPKLSIICTDSLTCDIDGCIICEPNEVNRAMFSNPNNNPNLKQFSFYEDVDLDCMSAYNISPYDTSPYNKKRSSEYMDVDDCEYDGDTESESDKKSEDDPNVKYVNTNERSSILNINSKNSSMPPTKKRAFQFDCDMVYW